MNDPKNLDYLYNEIKRLTYIFLYMALNPDVRLPDKTTNKINSEIPKNCLSDRVNEEATLEAE
jgi:hypothetical protein